MVMVSDRYTAKKEVSEHRGWGCFGEVGWLATGQDAQGEKGQQCRKCQGANDWLLERTLLRARGTSFLITLGPGQRSEAHNSHTYLPRYMCTHMQTIHAHKHTLEQTQM